MEKEVIKNHTLRKGDDIVGTSKNLARAGEIIDEMSDVKRDLLVGRALAYGVPASVGTAGAIGIGGHFKNKANTKKQKERDEYERNEQHYYNPDLSINENLSKLASFNLPLSQINTLKRLGRNFVAKGGDLARRNNHETLNIINFAPLDNEYIHDLQGGNNLKSNIDSINNVTIIDKKMFDYGSRALPHVMERLAFDMIEPPKFEVPKFATTLDNGKLRNKKDNEEKSMNLTKPPSIKPLQMNRGWHN